MKHWRLGVAVLATALVVGHPYLLGLTGRISEFRFEHRLRTGTPREQVLALALRLGYTPEPWARDVREGATGPLQVTFTDFATLCISGGKNYDLMFDQRSRLIDWKVENLVKRLLTRFRIALSLDWDGLFALVDG